MKGLGSLFTLASLLLVATASNVIDLTPDNFDKEILQSGKPALVEFFAVGLFFFEFTNPRDPALTLFI